MKTTQEILALSDSGLLEYLCSTQDDEVAYNEFVKRYYQDCKSLCEKICFRRKLHSHVGLQIVTDTFEKVRRYKSYRRSETTQLDEKKAINGFLFRIALNLFNDYYNQTKRFEEPKTTYFDDFATKAIAPEESLATKEFAELILKKLNKKEQAVIFADLEYKKHHNCLYLPDEVVEKLSLELEVKADTIRKIRERAKLKLQKAIDEYNEQ